MLSKIPKKTAFLLLTTLVVGYLFFEFFPQKTTTAGQKDERIEQVLGRPADFEGADLTMGKSFEGEHIYFLYPNNFANYDKLKDGLGENVLEAVRFDSEEPRMTISVMVNKGEGLAGIEDIPAVSLRRNSQLYKQMERKVSGIDAVSFQKTELEEGQLYAYESATFWVNEGEVFSLVIGAKDEQLGSKIADEVLATVKVL